MIRPPADHRRGRSSAAGTAGLLVLLVGGLMMDGLQGHAEESPAGPRAAAWKRVEQALDEGRPTTAVEALAGVERAAAADQAWAEVARAIATRILAETGDRAADDPERVVRLAAAIEQAPPEARPVLEAIRANWTWNFFQMNRWRFQQRTAGGADTTDLARMHEWDLPAIVGEIRRRFAAALDGGAGLATLPVGDWSMILSKGTMPDTYRPTVWDVVARDAIEFAASGERGLAAPEDAFELSATSPALGTADEFRAWRPDAGGSITDADSPILQAAALYRSLLDLHAADADPTAFRAADLDRIRWAAGAAVDDGDVTVTDRKTDAIEAFLARAGDHEIAAQAAHALAEIAREHGDLVEARALAAKAVERHPNSVGGRLCQNLVKEIDSKELSLATERAWAAPWPVVRVTYRNLAKIHLRLAKADWPARLAAGKPHPGWLDEDDRTAILALPAVRSAAVDLPATPDFRSRQHDVPVGVLDPESVEPGAYWVIASHDPGFGDQENVAHATLVWITRLAIVSSLAPNQQSTGEPLTGHVVDLASGEPVAGATVRMFVREGRGDPAPFVGRTGTTTDGDGRYQLAAEGNADLLLLATASLGGSTHAVPTDSMHFWPHEQEQRGTSSVLVTDRGIHRPGQTVFYKGIAGSFDHDRRDYHALAKRPITVTLRDSNGREVAKAEHTTSGVGSFHGSFAVPTGALPGQWMLLAETQGFNGGVGVRVEEYKRPKFQVELAPPADAVRLGEGVAVTGTAATYTGLPVAGAKVAWRVERRMRLPFWCRWCFPWLPFGDAGQKVARGTEVTGADGTFTIRFPALPDRGVPKAALPVFTYEVVADVTDSGGETRSDTRTVAAGYTDIEATIERNDWQAVSADTRDDRGQPAAAVALTLVTRSLDGEPRTAAGTLAIHPLVQPAAVDRGDIIGDHQPPAPPRPFGTARKAAVAADADDARPKPVVKPSDPDTWEPGAALVTREATTDAATGRAEVRAMLPAGIYRAVFTIPGRDGAPEVRTESTFAVIDPAGDRATVKRAFALTAAGDSVEAGREFMAIVGTGYDRGRAVVEISRGGRVRRRFWTDAGRTQWPVRVAAADEDRGGFTITAWMVRDGRLHRDQRIVQVPWTNKKLAVTWERFTRQLEPATQEVWRARITSMADPLAGPAAPAVAEVLALAYDQSLDALAEHQWPGAGLLGLFRGESGAAEPSFTNAADGFNGIRGSWSLALDAVEISYRELLESFGPPDRGRWGFAFGGGGGGMRFSRMRRVDEAMLMADAMPLAAREGAAPRAKPAAAQRKDATAASANTAALGVDGRPPKPDDSGRATPPPPRTNLAETAFFLPTLVSGSDGIVTIEFTLPDTLTTWQFKGLAHDAALRSGTIVAECVSAKDLMVEPLLPRFLREGDMVHIPVKVGNTSSGRLTGVVRFALADARTGDSRDGLVEGPREQAFDLAAGESKPVVFTVKVADGTDVLRSTVTGATTSAAKRAADGEESLVVVLPRRVPVTETVPITIRGPGERRVKLDRLLQSAGTEIRSESLVVQAASNPAWYGVLALPSIMESPDESIETLFARLYANAYARHLATADPRIAEVFAQWKGTDALESPLEKNADLVKMLLAETPWVRDAVDEREARGRIGLLLDPTRADNEVRAAFERLEALRNDDGGWPWFPDGRSCDPVTLAIIAGFGRLRTNGVAIDVQPAVAAVPWLDGRLVEEMRRGKEIKDPVLTPTGAYALFARSFFAADAPPQGDAAEAIRWGLGVGKTTWMKLGRRSQGHVALALQRAGDREAARSILESLKQRAVDADVKPGTEKDSWQGMWWRDQHPAWWSWAEAPIETQAVMIEAFDEIAGDADAVEAMKAWLLSRKRTSRWPGSMATADAVGALLGRGKDLLGSSELVTVTVGGEAVTPGKVEAGTGFFEERFVRREIAPTMGEIMMKKPDAGLAWGGVHWQYLDDITKVPAAGRDELAIEKQLFVKRFTKAGPVLEPATAVEPGDELVVRLVVTSDRDYEYLELADHRPSLTEPVDVLSGWRFGDGAAWYLAIRDASAQFFFERLPRGTHVFEYSLRAAYRGTASSGFARIQSRYAPEFSAHSASVPLEVK
ncbi:MAG: alpha-2-macroglobulin family protein [Planctomycetaceae bacterium]